MHKKIKHLFQTGFFHVFGSNVVNKIISFLSSIVLVRILTKEEYGIFTYAWNLYSIVLLACGMGMDSGVLQLCSEKAGNTDAVERICAYGARFGVRFNTLLGIVLLGIGLFVPLKIQGAGELLCLLCALPIFYFLYQLTTVYLRSQKRNQDFSKLNVINTAMVFGASALCALLFRERGMVLGYYIAYVVSILVGYRTFHVHVFDGNRNVSAEDRKYLHSISIVTMCNNGLSQLLYLLDVFVLGIVAAEESILASYRVATLIPAALTFIPSSLIVYIYPYFAEHRNDGKWCMSHYKKTVLGLGIFNACVSATLYLLAPYLIRIFFSEIYMDALPIFRILVINYFFSGTFRILSGNLLVTQRKLKFNLFVALVSGCVNVIADFLFIQWWGSLGAALATVMVVLISSILSTTYLVYTFRKESGM